MVSGQLSKLPRMFVRGESKPRLTRWATLPLVFAAVGFALLANAPRSTALPANDPGVFFALELGHEGERYDDRLPSGPTYRIRSGRLPSGLTLSTTGLVRGTPTETGNFEVRLSATQAGSTFPLRAEVTVYASDESDLQRVAPSFAGIGPNQVDAIELDVDVISPFDNEPVRTKVRLAIPRGVVGAPLLMFHRGRGFDEDNYQNFHRHIASHGIAVASVEDRLSFAGRSFSAENSFYDWSRAELGMLSASSVVEAVTDELLNRNDDSQDPLFRFFDPENLFFAGHSRGGGAVHGSHVRSRDLRLKGLIYLMAFDLRYFDDVAPPATSPAYDIPEELSRTPSLIIAAENDGDLSYPIADQLIDRATGPTTQVTLYGGVHNLISDSHNAEGNAKITRTQERTRVADWIVCFVKRWAEAELDLDWRLYGGAHQGSQIYGVTSWRPSQRTLMFEDAQDSNLSRNLLGPNYVASMRRRELDTYPPVGDLPTLGLKHTVLRPSASTSIWRLASDTALDLSKHTRVVFRVSQTSSRGWSKAGLWLRMIDGAGGVSWFRVWEPSSGGLLPEYDGLSPHDRFVDVHVDLGAFFASGSTPAADLSQARAIDLFVVDRGGFSGESVTVDALRFE